MSEMTKEQLDRCEHLIRTGVPITQREAQDLIAAARKGIEARRVEQCCECHGYVSDWVEADHRNGRICRPCETVIALRLQLAQVEAANNKLFFQLSLLGTIHRDCGKPALTPIARERFETISKVLASVVPPSDPLAKLLEPVIEKLNHALNAPSRDQMTSRIEEALAKLTEGEA